MQMNGSSINPFPTTAPALSPHDEQFRRLLMDLGQWSVHADRLFAVLMHTEMDPLSAAQRALLPEVAQAALQQVDIGMRYPKFYWQLLCNPTLRRAFVQQLRVAPAPRRTPFSHPAALTLAPGP